MLIDQYRTVRYYHQFFNHWAIKLEKLEHYRFLWWRWARWQRVCDHPFDDQVPHGWRDFNIVDQITITKLEIC